MASSYVVNVYYAVWDIYIWHRFERHSGETTGVYNTHTGCLQMYIETLNRIQCTLTPYKVYNVQYVQCRMHSKEKSLYTVVCTVA